ncbi:hypothetical protein HG530_013756 [Fusarium avenaceum]|nr:hypothetical protein HG530_013756 [Fusarium avenaceum]
MRSQRHLVSALNALAEWVLARLVAGLNRDLKLRSAVDTRSTIISVRGSRQVIIGVSGNNPGSLGVEADQRLVLGQLVLLDQSLLDSSEEVPVETCINHEDDDLGESVPDFIDANESALVSAYLSVIEIAGNLRVIDWGDSMRWNPNNKDGNVHKSDENGRAPF